MDSVERLIVQHRDYVRKLAREIHHKLPRQASYDDLVGFGEVGLVEAARKFDAGAGVAFTTFAYYRVRGAIFDGVRKMTWLPPAARRDVNAQSGADQVAEEAALAPDADVDPAAAAEAFNEAVERLGAVFLLSGLSDDEHAPEVVDHTEPGQAIEQRELKENLARAVESLPADQKTLLRQLYFEQVSMTDLAARMKVNKSTISRQHNKAIEALARTMAGFT